VGGELSISALVLIFLLTRVFFLAFLLGTVQSSVS
jgi:hypothetical protein